MRPDTYHLTREDVQLQNDRIAAKQLARHKKIVHLCQEYFLEGIGFAANVTGNDVLETEVQAALYRHTVRFHEL